MAVLLPACNNKKPVIQDGSEVTLHYTLTVDGSVADTSREGEPLKFTVGARQIIPGLEEQLMGLRAGDKKMVTVAPEKGYGESRPDAIQKVPRKNFKDLPDLKPGTLVTAQGNGNVIQARIVEIASDTVTLDLNHPMAGKTLNFDVEILTVGEPAAAPPESSEKG